MVGNQSNYSLLLTQITERMKRLCPNINQVVLHNYLSDILSQYDIRLPVSQTWILILGKSTTVFVCKKIGGFSRNYIEFLSVRIEDIWRKYFKTS